MFSLIKKIGMVAFVAFIATGVVFAEDDYNTSGYGDTTTITTFKADSLKYSSVFLSSAFENKRVVVAFNDTDAAGFKSDSVKFYYYIQTGARVYNSSNKIDTQWTSGPILDTVDMLTAGNYTLALTAMGTDGTFLDQAKYIDTTWVSGYAINARNFSPPWAPLIRFAFKGLTGNNVGSFIKLRVSLVQRAYIPVRSK